jgi:NTP pyrophosphatase (non-canonical NTP hydrolase)
MEIKDLTKSMHEFVTSQGWYDQNSPRPQTLRNLAISLCLECAEVLELFQWSDDSRQINKLPAELADVALYLLQLADIAGIDLETAIHDKLKSNYSRKWN